MSGSIQIHWFRQDLRLADNPALSAAAAKGAVLPVYILDDVNSGAYSMGAASRWWLHHSLNALNQTLDGKLVVLAGDPAEILPRLATAVAAAGIHWNRAYEPWRIARDAAIKMQFAARGIAVNSHNGSLLWEPWDVLKNDGTPYKVFTPFYRRGCLSAPPPRRPLPVPADLKIARFDEGDTGADAINALGLLPKQKWQDQLAAVWDIGEAAAYDRLCAFLDDGFDGYKDGRNFPARRNVSRLSAYLHWGEISPNAVWYAAKDRMDAGIGQDQDCDHFLSELGWREFSHSLLYHFPDLPHKNLQPRFDHFDWQDNPAFLQCWQKGITGYPIVDAGMRELWQTGYMHNRVRMIVGSFLVKNLRLHWHHGEAWFWDCLVDADLANNSAGWQWIAGCGADAAPYFRIFNPITQGVKFDQDGHYIRRYVPELATMPDAYLCNPWEAPTAVLNGAGVRLGETYPKPIVDVKASREAALAAFSALRAAS
ncbi:MAG: cryptochrome/photolyase family protein [Candidatus Puniceispirillaceae bacterium]